MAVGRAAWQLAMEMSPIFLQGGMVPSAIPGRMLPIMLATEIINFPLGILTSGRIPSLDDAFAHFQPVSGAMVINQNFATYPFANSDVAANSIIQQPLQLSYQMICPARGSMSYWTKLAKMTVLIEVLERHNKSGGRYALITPSFVYFNCLMRAMRDASGAQTKQVQNVWTLDFEKPLITVSDATTAEERLSNIMEQITNGQKIVGQPVTTGVASATAGAVPPAVMPSVPAAVPVWPGV